MKRILLLWLAGCSLWAWCWPAWAAEPQACLVAHLREAIALNRERAATYAALSDGTSRPLSRRLVASEMISLAAAYAAEALARFYWRADIPILCTDFVAMALSPPVQTELFEDRPDLSQFEPLDAEAVIARVRAPLIDGDFAAVHRQLEDEVEALSAEPRFHCMARHLLESAARMAWLAPQYDARAANCRAQRPGCHIAVAPSKLSRAMIEVHLQALRLGRDFDQRAAPLAARGVGIICDDVPPIAMRPVLDFE